MDPMGKPSIFMVSLLSLSQGKEDLRGGTTGDMRENRDDHDRSAVFLQVGPQKPVVSGVSYNSYK